MKQYTFTAGDYTEPQKGNSDMVWRGVQIVATNTETGKRTAIFTTGCGRTPCFKMGEWASHYKSGMNAADGQRFQDVMKKATAQAERWNTAGNAPKV